MTRRADVRPFNRADGMIRDVSDAQKALDRADELEGDVLVSWPRAWRDLDLTRIDQESEWPEWCLLPIEQGAAKVVREPAVSGPEWLRGPLPIAGIAGLYTWRFARSVYLVEPTTLERQSSSARVDPPTLQTFRDLPEWCVYLVTEDSPLPGNGVFAHLEYNYRSDRPELRLLIDFGNGGLGRLFPVTVHLDETALSDAISDLRTVAAVVDMSIHKLEQSFGGLLSVLAYLGSPEADIVHGTEPDLKPERQSKPVRRRGFWRVGYSS